jgi:hypothetical protein
VAEAGEKERERESHARETAHTEHYLFSRHGRRHRGAVSTRALGVAAKDTTGWV